MIANNWIAKHALATILTGGALSVLIWSRLHREWTAIETAGLLLLAPGFVLWSIARFELGASFSLAARARTLVTRGLYSKLRSPIYLFGSCVIAGTFLMLGRPAWLAVFLVIAPVQVWRARREAAVLEAEFGDKYRAYRASTWF